MTVEIGNWYLRDILGIEWGMGGRKWKSNLDLQIDHLLPYKDEKVIIYCRSGKRSITAALLLAEYGFKHLYNLQQGIIGHLNYL